MKLLKPSLELLPSYQAALARGWSPDNTRAARGAEELEESKADPQKFIASLDDVEAKGAPIILPDGTKIPRLPGFRRWAWDGAFCGSIGFRWQPGTEVLPPHCLGHIGYGVVPWKEGRGCAKFMLAQMLPEARAVGLKYVDITTNTDNVASQRVILANGGVFIREFVEPEQFASRLGHLYRITL